MALNLQTFKTRTLTAVIFVVVMVAGVLWSRWSFFILFSIIHFGCWIEYQKLVGKIDPDYAKITPLHKYGVMLAGWCILLYFTNDLFSIFGLHLHEIGWWLGLLFVFVLPIIEILFAGNLQLKNIGYSALGLLYISLSWGLMIDLRCRFVDFHSYEILDFGLFPVILLIGAIWINDTMAYIVGSLIGKRPLSSVSPKKTWEGTVGGALLAIGVIAIICILSDNHRWWLVSLIALVICVTGTFGDLLESKLKRMANVKDSGHIMPGHGGFLDRFDSLLIATPFCWLFIMLLQKFAT
jgi:phosphatidate cytidylyltransferase